MRIAAIVTCLACPAFAEPQCAPRADVVAGLFRNYGETARAEGLTNEGIVEMYAAPSGSWTLTLTRPDGITCLLSSGGMFHTVPQGVQG